MVMAVRGRSGGLCSVGNTSRLIALRRKFNPHPCSLRFSVVGNAGKSSDVACHHCNRSQESISSLTIAGNSRTYLPEIAPKIARATD